MPYTIQIGAGAEQTPESLGVMSARLSLAANGFDSLGMELDAGIGDAPAFSPGDKITLRDGETVRFIGEIIDDPRDVTASDGPTHSYSALSYLAALDRHAFGQTVFAFVGGELGQVYDPRVVLGRARPNGARITASAQIAAVVAYAAAVKGVPVAVDAASWPAGFEAPLDERSNVSCWEAIVCQLRWMPDHVLYCDYSSGSTVVRLRPSASLAPVSVAADGGILATARFRPRRDLQKPGVRLLFRRVDDVEGVQREMRSVQTAGDFAAAAALELYIDLEGGSTSSVEQDVTAADIPTDAWLAWLKARVSWLSAVADADITIHGVHRVSSHPRELVSGSVSSWMGVSQESDTITFDVSYGTKDLSGAYVDKARIKIPVRLTATTALTKTYRKTTQAQAPEPVPAGLAAGIHDAWSMLHWDGSFSSHIDAVGWSAAPGAALSVTGGPAEWASMAAAVQDLVVELADGSCSIRAGTCRRLEADSLTALYRALRGRRQPSPATADDAASPAALPGAVAFPSDAFGDSPAFARSFLRVSSSDPAHKVTIDPASIVFTDSAHSQAQEIALREIAVLFPDAAGNPVARLSQVLCSAPYGAAIVAADPERPVELGGDGEGGPLGEGADDGALSDTYDPAQVSPVPEFPAWAEPEPDQDGLRLWVVSRFRYDHESETPVLYAYLRRLTWPKACAPLVSAETRVIIDEPVEPDGGGA